MIAEPLPVSVLTGFLGAGKTTLLNRLLKDPGLADAAVIINEFGDIGIDHLLVETADDGVFEMASGCLCCTIRGDLSDTIDRLFERRRTGTLKAFDRVVIETTGLADPAPILHTLMSEPTVSHCRLEGVVTVVDAVNGEATLDAHGEAVKQAAVADRIVIAKTDLLEGEDGVARLARLKARLAALNPGARLLDARQATAARLFDCGLWDAAAKTADVGRWLRAEAYADAGHHHHRHDVNRHDDHISAFCVASEAAVTPQAFQLFSELLRSYHGPNLLRLKGIVKLADDPSRPLVVHAVQHLFHPPVRLPGWPDGDHRTRLVFITRDIPKGELEALYEAFTDPLRGSAEARRDDTLSLRGAPMREAVR